MTVAARIKHYVALHTYETRKTWRHFKEDVIELWQYWHFRFGGNKQKMGVYTQAERLRARARRRLASVFLRDAQREENSMRTRADLAYEAAYLYALARLGAEADEYTHPEPAALNTAAELMGLTAEQIAPAIAYIMKRYAPSVSEAEDSAAYGALLDIAQKMQGRNE